MRKLTVLAVLLAAAFLLPAQSQADTIVASAVYSRSTSNTAFSAPGTAITFTFALPAQLDPSLDAMNVPVTVNFKGATSSTLADIAFYSASDGGLFNFFFTAGGHAYEWDFFGLQQVYNGSDVLVPGTYGIDTNQSAFYRDFGIFNNGSFTSGSVVVNGAAAVPEPTSLLLMGMGLFGLVPALRSRFSKK